jgi:phenylpyruvate tautomerase PptA (4-oxalocrotonate tautomerase family)
MAQVKVYGRKGHLRQAREEISAVIHACVVEALGLPPEKKFHRFLPLEDEDFLFPSDRTERYTIVEISMFEGRTVEAKKRLIRLLYERFESKPGISPQDLEITIFETPRRDWGIRGMPGDELELGYRVDD